MCRYGYEHGRLWQQDSTPSSLLQRLRQNGYKHSDESDADDDISEFNEDSGYESPINERQTDICNSRVTFTTENSTVITHFTKLSMEKGDGKKNFKYINW